MQSLAELTLWSYAFAFFMTFGVVAYAWYRRSRRRTLAGEAPPRHVDDRSDRMAS